MLKPLIVSLVVHEHHRCFNKTESDFTNPNPRPSFTIKPNIVNFAFPFPICPYVSTHEKHWQNLQNLYFIVRIQFVDLLSSVKTFRSLEGIIGNSSERRVSKYRLTRFVIRDQKVFPPSRSMCRLLHRKYIERVVLVLGLSSSYQETLNSTRTFWNLRI